MQNKKFKASVLAVTLVILGVFLVMALSVSLVSVQGRKSSMSSNKSSLAYQTADSGIEAVLQKIKDTDPATGTLANIDNDCDGLYDPGTGYEVELKDAGGALVTGCATFASTIEKIKSTGTAGQDSRAIEVTVTW